MLPQEVTHHPLVTNTKLSLESEIELDSHLCCQPRVTCDVTLTMPPTCTTQHVYIGTVPGTNMDKIPPSLCTSATTGEESESAPVPTGQSGAGLLRECYYSLVVL